MCRQRIRRPHTLRQCLMTMNNFIYEYHQKIQSGEITVGRYIRTLYEIVVNGIANGAYRFNAKKANRAIKFIENYCRHCEGRSDLLKLELWQKAAVSLIFGIVDDNGMRTFREVFIVIARKNGKTLLASAIIACMVYIDGEYGAKVYCLAPKLDQAAIVYDNFYQMVLKEPEMSEVTKKRRSDIYISMSNSSVKPVAFNAKKADGYNPHLAVCDEIASWQAVNGVKLYDVIKSAFGARGQPMLLSISTAGFVDDGPYDELMKRSTAFLRGSSKEKRLLPLLYIIDDQDKWNDIEELKKSNPNLGVSVSKNYYLDEIAVAEASPTKRIEFLTKYCNIKQNSVAAWLDRSKIDASDGDRYELSDFADCYAVGGIDLSQTTDLTAASIVIEKNNVLHAFTQFFMPRERIAMMQELDDVPYELFVRQGLITPSGDNFVDYRDVYNWFVRLVEEYRILPLQVGYDRYTAKYLVDDMSTYGFHMDDVFQGENLYPVIQEFEGILNDGNFRVCGKNNLLRGHLLNVALKYNLESRRARPVKIDARSRIDGFVSVIDALTVRQKWYADIGERLKNK